MSMIKVQELEGYAEISHEILITKSLKKFPTLVEDILHAAVGISGEAGELLDAVKKHWVYGKPLDMVNVIEELGDLEYYMRAMYKVLNLNRAEVLIANIEKLNKRYPTGYANEAAMTRADKIPEETTLQLTRIIPKGEVPLARLAEISKDIIKGTEMAAGIPFSNEAHELREWNKAQDDFEKKGNI